MEASRFISHHTIQEGLIKGAFSVNENIINPLKINRDSITLLELLHLIYEDLQKMNFTIFKTERLHDGTGKIVPGMTKLKTYDRKDGGVVLINKNNPKSLMLEAFFHEYIHIKDESLPILPMDEGAVNWKALYDKSYLTNIEFQVNMSASTLMMPPKMMWDDLIETAYNIDKLLAYKDKYKNFNKYSVLKWVSIIGSRFPCHFACVQYDKNFKGEIVRRDEPETYFYDHNSDPQPFDIIAVLNNSDSAAATAFNIKKPESVQKVTNINGIEYYCYAYYEANLSREEMSGSAPGITAISYDRLMVIGWKKSDYVFIQAQLNKQ